MGSWNQESRFSSASGNDLPYVVMQVTLKEKLFGTGSGNLTDLEDVINAQVAKGYRLHTMSTSNGGSKGNSGSTAVPNTGGASGGASALLAVASSKLGCPYVWGSKGPNSFDCSGFVYWCLNQVGVRQSYMTSSGWRNAGRYTRISSFSNLRAGDIIVVSGHVGIVAGGGTVIDASSGNGKVVHRSLSSWWANNFICGWRIF